MSTTRPNDQSEPFCVVHPPNASPGSLGVVVPESRLAELDELQKERVRRIWSVRGMVSDHILLSGIPQEIIAIPRRHLLYLTENPLLIYLHKGGLDATYYELVADAQGQVQYIEVRVDTDLPSNAFLLARKPLNEILDAIICVETMPLLYHHLELVSPRDNQILAYEMILPFNKALWMGPLGGIYQSTPFASYDAIFREAMTSISPFYRLLCASRAYEGTNVIRRWLKTECDRFSIKERLPSDPSVDPEHLVPLGFSEEIVQSVRTAGDLFNKLLVDERNAIAHFLLQNDQGSSHVYLADGPALQMYSLGAALLLHYARRTIDELKTFYRTHLQGKYMGGSILPMPEQRDRFAVRDPHFFKDK